MEQGTKEGNRKVHASTIFQRTESGRAEIKNKMHGLTQSERLALIVVDGVSPYSKLRQKLKGLADERFQRALTKLAQKNLIFEVLLQTGEEQEALDSASVDRFLHQDPLDPVTIISFDAEDEYGIDMSEEAGGPVTEPRPPDLSSTRKRAGCIAKPSPAPVPTHAVEPPSPPRLLTVDIYLPLEKSASKHAAALRIDQRPFQSHEFSASGGSRANDFSNFNAPVQKVQWGQLAMAAGIIIIVASILFKLAH